MDLSSSRSCASVCDMENVLIHPNFEPPILHDKFLEKKNPDARNAGKKKGSKFQRPRASRRPCTELIDGTDCAKNHFDGFVAAIEM